MSGRSSDWHGAAIKLDPTVFKAGGTYSFSAAVLQGTNSAQNMKMTLQYNDASGTESYDGIASASAKDRTWTDLSNDAYTIPEGATDLLLYIEMPDSLANFYVDNFTAASSGTKSAIVTGQGKVNIPESKIDTSKKLVAISFDDGAVGSSPSSSSMRIINAIADAGWHATFFYVGSWIRDTSGEQEVKYAYSKGMEIANHTWSHPDLTKVNSSQIRSEFDQTHSKLKSIIGTEPSKLLRLPYLSCNSTVQSTLSDVVLISCAVDSGDWKDYATKQDVINNITAAMNNGTLENSIVLCHETKDWTADAIEYLVPVLEQNGYQIVTVSELFEARGQQLRGGQIYTRAN